MITVVKSIGERLLDAIYRGDLKHIRYVPAKGKQMMDDLPRLNEACKAINAAVVDDREARATALLRSLVADIEAMIPAKAPDLEADDINPADFFGPFDTFSVIAEEEEDDCGATILWPNLRVQLDKAKELLK